MHQVAASSAYKGWADVDLGSSLVAHAGWKGYQICEESVGICSDNTDSESDDCLYDAMRAAGALAILTTLAGFYVLLVSLFEALQVLPGWAGVTLPDCHYLLHGCEPVLVGKLLGQGQGLLHRRRDVDEVRPDFAYHLVDPLDALNLPPLRHAPRQGLSANWPRPIALLFFV
eukprot:m.58745 g.58745  ORF g.58745 m.58745 type:complete len:172 (-) comp49189_c0_seq1:53-568(-)